MAEDENEQQEPRPNRGISIARTVQIKDFEPVQVRAWYSWNDEKETPEQLEAHRKEAKAQILGDLEPAMEEYLAAHPPNASGRKKEPDVSTAQVQYIEDLRKQRPGAGDVIKNVLDGSGKKDVKELTGKQASTLIDELKKLRR